MAGYDLGVGSNSYSSMKDYSSALDYSNLGSRGRLYPETRHIPGGLEYK